MRILLDHDNLVGWWVGDHIGKRWYEGAGHTLGWLNETNLVAGVTFTNFDGANIWVDCAALPGARWLDRRGLYAIFHYVFVQLECLRVSCMIPEDNEKSIKLVTQTGFKQEARLERAAPHGKDMLVFRMFKEECRWLERGLCTHR